MGTAAIDSAVRHTGSTRRSGPDAAVRAEPCCPRLRAGPLTGSLLLTGTLLLTRSLLLARAPADRTDGSAYHPDRTPGRSAGRRVA